MILLLRVMFILIGSSMRSIIINRIRFVIAGLLLISVPMGLYSQQDIYYYNYDFIAFKNNPAYTGDESLNDLIILTRQQWVGFKGAPKSYLLASHFKLASKNAAVGIELSSINTGPVKETGFYFHYSYKIPVTGRSELTMGLKGGMDIYNINLTDLILIDPFDPLFESDVNRKILPNFGVGLHYSTPGYYFDFSIPGIMRNHLNPAGSGNSAKEDKQDRLFITGGGAKFDISSDITLTPAAAIWLVKGSPVLINMK